MTRHSASPIPFLVAAGRIWDNHPMIVTTLLGAKAPASTDETAGLIQGPMPEPG